MLWVRGFDNSFAKVYSSSSTSVLSALLKSANKASLRLIMSSGESNSFDFMSVFVTRLINAIFLNSFGAINVATF